MPYPFNHQHQHLRPVEHGKVPELWGATEVADYLGIKRPNVYREKLLPAPVAHLANGLIWLADEIRDYKPKRDARVGHG